MVPSCRYQSILLRVLAAEKRPLESAANQESQNQKVADMPEYIPIQEFAAKLRLKPTKGEAALLPVLTPLGFEFQCIVGRFVVDFFHPDHKLVIEVDGRSHDEKAFQDREREQELLHEFGVSCILRFTDELVCEKPGQISVTVRKYIDFLDAFASLSNPSMAMKVIYRVAKERTGLTKKQMDKILESMGLIEP
jgi:very-short-patch-repair endonuclease